MWWCIPLSALIAFVVGLICYLIVQQTYADQKFDDYIDDLNFMVKIQKKLAKGRKLDKPKEDKVRMEKITKGYGNVDVSDYPDITAIFVGIKVLQGSSLKYDGTAKEDMTKVEKLVQRKEEITDLLNDHLYKRGYKNYAGITSSVITFSLWRFYIIPVVFWLFNDLKESTVLRDSLNQFIPETLSVQDIVTDEVMITAWDINNRTPRFFSKWYQKNDKNHDMSFLDMIWTSASTQFYFKPAVVNDNVYISGTNYARSPAFFAYLLANEKNGIKQEDINIVSIGATNEQSDMIDSTMGLVDWV